MNYCPFTLNSEHANALDKRYKELHKNMENTIEQIKSLVNELNLQNTTLMEKPSEDELKYLWTEFYKGYYIKTDIHTDEDPIYWCYPNGVKEKIEDDKIYKVWSNNKFVVGDSTTYRNIKYIEEVPDDKIELIKYLEKLLKELK